MPRTRPCVRRSFFPNTDMPRTRPCVRRSFFSKHACSKKNLMFRKKLHVDMKFLHTCNFCMSKSAVQRLLNQVPINNIISHMRFFSEHDVRKKSHVDMRFSHVEHDNWMAARQTSCRQQTAPPQSRCSKDVTSHPHRPGARPGCPCPVPACSGQPPSGRSGFSSPFGTECSSLGFRV